MKNTWVELDLEILRENIRCLKTALNSATEIIFLVKSNAYGHGMAPVAQCAWDCGVKWFVVAYVDEAVTLRELLPKAHIIIAGVINPADAAVAIEKDLLPVIVSETHALSLAAEAAAGKSVLRCHANIDTGMGRLGFVWQEAAKILPGLARRPGLDIQGMFTHFASVRLPPCAGSEDGQGHSPDRSFADIQAERFHKVIQDCEAMGMSVPFKHMSKSGAILRESAWDMDGVRPGIMLYGYGGQAPRRSSGQAGQADKRQIETLPFLQWKTRVIQVKKVPAGFPVSYDSTYVTDRETHVATIDAGYADGYSRLLSNKGCVIIGGRRRPVIGRVTMNFVTVDLGPATNVKEGDEVVLLGSQGGESIWADEIAELCGTISYEVLTNIRTDDRRVVR